MTDEETLVLLRYVKACCPQQHIDKFTPEAWYDLLSDLPLADCRAAVRQVARRQPFVAPAEIRAEVQAMRRERLDAAEMPAPPAGLADDPRAYCAWLREATAAIASGTARPALEGS